MEKVSDWIFVWKSWGEPKLNKNDILTLLRIIDIRFLAPTADPEILRFMIRLYIISRKNDLARVAVRARFSAATSRNSRGFIALVTPDLPFNQVL